MHLALFALGLVLTAPYASVVEWLLHKYGMHNPRIKVAYNRHAKTHHIQRRAGCAFYGDDPYHLLQSSAIPLILLTQVPLYLGIMSLSSACAAGFATGAALYVVGYEVLHVLIHNPPLWIQNQRWFQWFCERHRVHHYMYLWNYNVVFPFADWIFGTYASHEIPPEPSAPPAMCHLTGPASVFRR